MNTLLTALEKQYLVLAPGSWGDSDNKNRQAIQKFNELMLRLELRYNELLLAEQQFNDYKTKNIGELQLRLVDKTEAFHQHVYATLSGFVMLLNHILSSDEKRGLPTRSIRSFIEYLHQSIGLPEQLYKTLKLARDFRTFTDHIQISRLHDWMTMGFTGGQFGSQVAIIYFVRNTRNVFAPNPDHCNPYSSDFIPPVDHDGFIVTPPYKETYNYFKETIIFVLTHFAKLRVH